MKQEATAAVFVEAVGLIAPGLAGWTSAQPVLCGAPYTASPLPPHAPGLLPANERRRASPTGRLAFAAAEDAMQRSSISPAAFATVFASSDADLAIIHRICTALTATPRQISPTDFHNSVHNAAAGYWTIAVGARGPSSSLSAYDDSFTLGLAEACAITSIERTDTLLVAFDLPPPEPLYSKRPIAEAAGVALALSANRTSNSLVSLQCEWAHASESTMATPALEALRLSNPAARALPLLQLLAEQRSGTIVLPRAGGAQLTVTVTA
jgi:hypothetical protein